MIELLPRKGARIRVMDREEMANWWVIYRAIACLGIRGAAENIVESPENVVAVREAVQRIEAAARTTTPARFVMTLLDFHRVMDAISDNPMLDEAIRRLQVAFWALLFPRFIPFDVYWDVFVRNYRRVADAVMIGDPRSAEGAFYYHVEWSSAIILGERPDPDEPWVASAS